MLVMKRERPEELGTETISELVGYVKEKPKDIRSAMPHEFFFRPDCYLSLKQVYSFSFRRPNIETLAPGIGFDLLSDGKIDVVVALSTNPLIIELDLVKLEDDKEALIPHCVGIAAREETVNESPSLSELVDDLMMIS